MLGSIVVCVAFYLYFADFNRVLIDHDTQQDDAQHDTNSETFPFVAEPDPENGDMPTNNHKTYEWSEEASHL